MRYQVLASAVLICGACFAQSKADPVVASSQQLFNMAKNDILRSADKVPDELWSFQPTPEVRTFAQMFAHVADGQYEFCGAAAGKPVDKGIEKTAKTKADITAALKEAFAFCETTYSGMTRDSALGTVRQFGAERTRLSIMDFNVAHTMEHYGNLVTYMRLKGIVPPSSERK